MKYLALFCGLLLITACTVTQKGGNEWGAEYTGNKLTFFSRATVDLKENEASTQIDFPAAEEWLFSTDDTNEGPVEE